MKILADASLPVLKEAFPDYFAVQTYHSEAELTEQIANADILLCRTTVRMTNERLKSANLKLLATASSGVDHIQLSGDQWQQLPIISAKGANAQAVADWVLSVLAHIDKDIRHHKVGIIGLGCVGSEVNTRLKRLGYHPLTCDPWLANQADFNHTPLNQLTDCHALFIHANLHHQPPDATYHLINQAFLSQVNQNCYLINASRGNIVDESALLNYPICQRYCTDVFADEPGVNGSIIDQAYICSPHIAGHSKQAKIKAVFQVSQAIHQYFSLPLPPYPELAYDQFIHLSRTNWQQPLLAHYDVMNETQCLKRSLNKRQTFQQLRAQHRRDELCVHM